MLNQSTPLVKISLSKINLTLSMFGIVQGRHVNVYSLPGYGGAMLVMILSGCGI